MAAGPTPRLLPRKYRSYYEDNNTKLHAACYFGDYNSALMLLLAADPRSATTEARNTWGETPLHQCTSRGHLELVLLLLDASADVNAVDNESLTPLHQALIHSNREAVELLLCYGAHIYNSDISGDQLTDSGGTTKSPLEFASYVCLNTCYDLVKSAEGKVWSLQHICRIAIRKYLGVTKRRRIKELPLPRHLISFLMSLPVSCTEQLHANWGERTKTIKSKSVKTRQESHKLKSSNMSTGLYLIRSGKSD